MEKWQALAEIAKGIVRPLCTVVLVGVYCFLAVTGQGKPDLIKDITVMALSFWFATRTDK